MLDDASDAEAALRRLLEDAKGQESFAHDAHSLVELADRDPPRRVRVLQDLLDDLGDVSGIGALHLVAFHHGDRFLARRSIRVIAGDVTFFRAAVKPVLKLPGSTSVTWMLKGATS